MKRLLAACLMAIATVIMFQAADSQALGLKVQPQSYKTSLKDGESQRGFVDISNPSALPVLVRVSVQGFRQINDDGGLEFYEDQQLSTAIKPELTTLSLDGKDAVRLAFTVNGDTLPEGDVYAALFFTTDLKQPQNGVGQQVRVGTLLSIVNKSPGERSARVTGLDIPLLQLTETVKGSYDIRNTGAKTVGFYPTVAVSAWPSSARSQVESTLVFGGRERANEFALRTGFGIYRIQARYGDSSKQAWVIAIAPWMLILGTIILVVVTAELAILRRKRKNTTKRTS